MNEYDAAIAAAKMTAIQRREALVNMDNPDRKSGAAFVAETDAAEAAAGVGDVATREALAGFAARTSPSRNIAAMQRLSYLAQDQESIPK